MSGDDKAKHFTGNYGEQRTLDREEFLRYHSTGDNEILDPAKVVIAQRNGLFRLVNPDKQDEITSAVIEAMADLGLSPANCENEYLGVVQMLLEYGYMARMWGESEVDIDPPEQTRKGTRRGCSVCKGDWDVWPCPNGCSLDVV